MSEKPAQNNAVAFVDAKRLTLADITRIMGDLRPLPEKPEPLYLIVPHALADEYRKAFASAYCVVIDERELERCGFASDDAVWINGIRAHRIDRTFLCYEGISFHQIAEAPAAKPDKPYYRRFERKRRAR